MAVSLRLAVALALPLVTLSAVAASNPWDGTWKFNPAKSQTAGYTFTITETAPNAYHYSEGSAYAYDFTCDGKPNPLPDGRIRTCSGNVGSGYDTSLSAAGKVITKSHRTFSPDGKTIHMETVAYHADGTTSTERYVFQKLDGTKGLAGKWKTVQDASSPSLMQVSVAGNVMHSLLPADKSFIDCKLDGSDAAIQGPTAPRNTTYAMKLENPTKVHYVVKLNGAAVEEGTETLSDNGKVMTVISWTPGKTAEKSTAIYEKQ